jgi:pyocin large subunit-like protein
MKNILLVLLLLGVMTVDAKPKRYRIVVKRIEGKIYYIPQIKKGNPSQLLKEWVDLANQPLKSENEAMNYVRESRIIENQLKETEIIQYIKID